MKNSFSYIHFTKGCPRSVRVLFLLLLIVLGTAGFTSPGCSEEQKKDAGKLVAEYVTNLAFNKLADLLDKQLNELEEKLSGLKLPEDVRTHYQRYLTDFRELSGEVRKVRSREDFDELAGMVKGLYRDVRCHLDKQGDEIRGQLSSLFNGVGEVVEPLEVKEPAVEEGGPARAANRRNFGLCP